MMFRADHIGSLTAAEQFAKLRLVAGVARSVWG